MREPTWVLIMPVKRLPAAKSRLRGALPGVPHERLALALAQDTVAAAVRCAEVLVVTADPQAGGALAALGARVVPDLPDAGLNAALSYGAGLAAGPRRRIAALTADLPALRARDLSAALAAAGPGRAFVADAGGTGTTLLAAAAGPGEPLDPGFGAGSALTHAASGARELSGAAATLRRDVDSPADLAGAAVLGLGGHTAGVLREYGADAALREYGADPVPGRRDGSRLPRARTPAGYGAGMQGTVATYDAETRSGTLLLDDGTEIIFPAAAFEASGLRFLRQGQRVRIDHDDSGQVVRVTLPTF